MVELPFTLKGVVARGKHLGSRLGFPTANIVYQAEAGPWPKEGVYVGIAQIEGLPTRYLTILNQGKHPTAPGGTPTVEAHLIGFPYESLYDSVLHLTYCQYLREEQRFQSLEALKRQLQQDREAALIWAGENLPPFPTPSKGE